MANKPHEPPDYKPPKSAKELLTRYAAGERCFSRADLRFANLRFANLRDADFSRADISHANLSSANLRSANLYDTDLSEVDFSYADLSETTLGQADLRSANLSSAKLLRADLRETTLRDAKLGHADLGHGNLSRADLRSANLSRADLRDAALLSADLRSANLCDANLSRTDFRGADLSNADLSGANLSDADLRNADLRVAVLLSTDFHGANLRGADLRGARIGNTVLSDLDLSPFCAIVPPVLHAAESIVSFSAIVRSLLSPRLEDFLVRAGIPSIAAQYMIESAKAVSGSLFDMMRSTFISYGGPDEEFAEKLYEKLHKNGVTTFYFPAHAEPGKAIHRIIRDGVRKHDRVILVCSKESLMREGVLNEIEECLRREAKKGGEMLLIPITLDDFVYGDDWKPPDPGTAEALRARVIGDFRGADTDEAKFDAALSKLLRALRVKAGPLDPSGAAGP